MTPEHAARRLLAHGPLTRTEFLAITGWPPDKAEAALRVLMECGELAVSSDGKNGGHGDRYWLRAQIPPSTPQRKTLRPMAMKPRRRGRV